MTFRSDRPSRLQLLAAFGVIYFVWGSTYLAIKVAIETVPPFLMMGSRFAIAGILLYAYAAYKGAPRPQVRDLGPISVLAMTMIVLGTGLVAWVETYLDSGMTSLLVSLSPVWMVVMEAFRKDGARPGLLGGLGISVGLLGVFFLIGPDGFGGSLSPFALVVLLCSTICWSIGSIYGRHTNLRLPPLQTSALQMILGGVVLFIGGMAKGELVGFELSALTAHSLGAILYLIFFGSLLVFPTYLWLLKASTPARVGTHSYVNPLVALALGWLFAGEVIGARTLLSAMIILVAVMMISMDKMNRRKPKPEHVEEPITASLEPTG